MYQVPRDSGTLIVGAFLAALPAYHLHTAAGQPVASQAAPAVRILKRAPELMYPDVACLFVQPQPSPTECLVQGMPVKNLT
jgi:hypothetical protein